MGRAFVFLMLFGAFALCAAQTPAPAALDLVKQGQKLNGEGKQDDALALYRQALAISPNLYEAHLASGIALDLQGDFTGGRKQLMAAVEFAPADAKQQALRAMAISYAFEGNAAEASKFEQQVFDARESAHDFIGAAEIANELARIYLESGDTAAAYKWYQSGYETALQKPNLTSADKNLWLFRWENAQARMAARNGKSDEAQQHVTAAKAALDKADNPDQARFIPYLTGYVAFYAGDYKTAIADLQKADQHDPLILALLGESYEKSGDRSQAKDYYQKVLALNTHNPTNAFARPLVNKKLAAEN
jgi:tetratricopeptide (TPR) repeat protein